MGLFQSRDSTTIYDLLVDCAEEKNVSSLCALINNMNEQLPTTDGNYINFYIWLALYSINYTKEEMNKIIDTLHENYCYFKSPDSYDGPRTEDYNSLYFKYHKKSTGKFSVNRVCCTEANYDIRIDASPIIICHRLEKVFDKYNIGTTSLNIYMDCLEKISRMYSQLNIPKYIKYDKSKFDKQRSSKIDELIKNKNFNALEEILKESETNYIFPNDSIFHKFVINSISYNYVEIVILSELILKYCLKTNINMKASGKEYIGFLNSKNGIEVSFTNDKTYYNEYFANTANFDSIVKYNKIRPITLALQYKYQVFIKYNYDIQIIDRVIWTLSQLNKVQKEKSQLNKGQKLKNEYLLMTNDIN
jgi:hypothetical protein